MWNPACIWIWGPIISFVAMLALQTPEDMFFCCMGMGGISYFMLSSAGILLAIVKLATIDAGSMHRLPLHGQCDGTRICSAMWGSSKNTASWVSNDSLLLYPTGSQQQSTSTGMHESTFGDRQTLSSQPDPSSVALSLHLHCTCTPCCPQEWKGRPGVCLFSLVVPLLGSY